MEFNCNTRRRVIMAIPQWETPPCATDRIRQWETPPTAAYGLSFQKATFLRARLVGTSTVSEAPSPIHMGNTGKYNGKHRRVLLTEFANGKRHPQQPSAATESSIHIASNKHRRFILAEFDSSTGRCFILTELLF